MSAVREDAFAAFYEATWRRTVACAYGMTGDLASAEDLAQEAYCRAWRRWSKLQKYDDPGAWVRLVTTHLAVSRWRRRRTSFDFLARARGPEPVDPPSEATVVLVAALRKLPEEQRRALVLHYFGDLTVAAIATVEDCPEGTVKGRLSRGRAVLAQLLGAPSSPEGEASHA